MLTCNTNNTNEQKQRHKLTFDSSSALTSSDLEPPPPPSGSDLEPPPPPPSGSDLEPPPPPSSSTRIRLFSALVSLMVGAFWLVVGSWLLASLVASLVFECEHTEQLFDLMKEVAQPSVLPNQTYIVAKHQNGKPSWCIEKSQPFVLSLPCIPCKNN